MIHSPEFVCSHSAFVSRPKYIAHVYCLPRLAPPTVPQHPIQSPPPCLGYVFHQEGHGVVLCHMLSAVHDLITGAPSIRDKLENILTRLQGESCDHHVMLSCSEYFEGVL